MRAFAILAVLGDFSGVVGVGEGQGIRRGRSLRPRVTKNGYLLMFSIILFA
jgi:ribosomal protein S5